MKYPTTRFVFDRKNTASKNKAALIQVEILHERKRKYISTGVKVFKDQWSEKSHITNRLDMVDLNRRIDEIKGRFDKYINSLIEKNISFDFLELEKWMSMSDEKQLSFVEWVAMQIDERNDIEGSTKRTQRKLVPMLEYFGQFSTFSDLTPANVLRFDNFLRSRSLKQSTIWSYHKTLKTYTRLAVKLDFIQKDPYLNFKADRGKTEWGKFLTEEEYELLVNAKMPTESIERVRDLFVMQCLTGLSYSDLMDFDFSKVRENMDGQFIFSAERKKTGVLFTIVLLPQALEILVKYDYVLPKISNVQYNMRLKVVADAAGIDKPIASHYGRRTCGMLLLNKGFPIEIVAKVLGHTNIRTTQQAYARILDSSVEREFAQRMGIGNKDTHE